MEEQSLPIAVIGGGPAGAFLAYQLAIHGREPVIFHFPLQKEKACGGGVPFRTLRAFPVLSSMPVPFRRVFEVIFLTRRGRQLPVCLEEPITVVSRTAFDSAILDLAVRAGVRVIPERVDRIQTGPSGFRLFTEEKIYHTEFLAGADGASGICSKWFLKGTPLFRRSFGCGYYLPFPESKEAEPWKHKIFIQFLKDRKGYLWSFPRTDHLSAGVGYFFEDQKGSVMLSRVREFIGQALSPRLLRHARPFAAMLPIMDYLHPEAASICGTNWALVGDAAGLTDPITGEGIHYALTSAFFLARAIVSGEPLSYSLLCKESIFPEMKEALRLFNGFYKPGFTDKLLLVARVYPPLRKVLRDMVSETMCYRDLEKTLTRGPFVFLKKRVHRTLYGN